MFLFLYPVPTKAKLWVLKQSVEFHINPRPVGVFPNSARRWRGHFVPPAIWQTTGPIHDPKTVFDSPGHEFSVYIAKFHLKVTDDFTGQVKGQILYFL